MIIEHITDNGFKMTNYFFVTFLDVQYTCTEK